MTYLSYDLHICISNIEKNWFWDLIKKYRPSWSRSSQSKWSFYFLLSYSDWISWYQCQEAKICLSSIFFISIIVWLLFTNVLIPLMTSRKSDALNLMLAWCLVDSGAINLERKYLKVQLWLFSRTDTFTDNIIVSKSRGSHLQLCLWCHVQCQLHHP